MSAYEDSIQIQKMINLLLESYMDDSIYTSIHETLNQKIAKFQKNYPNF